MAKAPFGTIVLAFALAAAGCGGGGETQELSREEFEQELSEARTQVEESLGSLSAGELNDPEALAERVSQTATELRDIATDLGAADVPEDAEEPTERLVENLQRFADELEDVAERVEEGGVQAIVDATRNPATSEAAREVQQALEDLREAGFDIGGTQ